MPHAPPSPAVGRISAPGPGPGCSAPLQAGGIPLRPSASGGIDCPQVYPVEAVPRLDVHHQLPLALPAIQLEREENLHPASDNWDRPGNLSAQALSHDDPTPRGLRLPSARNTKNPTRP